jgi:hypothetical protein
MTQSFPSTQRESEDNLIAIHRTGIVSVVHRLETTFRQRGTESLNAERLCWRRAGGCAELTPPGPGRGCVLRGVDYTSTDRLRVGQTDSNLGPAGGSHERQTDRKDNEARLRN